MAGGFIGAFLIIGDNLCGRYILRDPVEEYERDAFILQFTDRRGVLGCRAHRHQYAIGPASPKVLQDGLFFLKALMGQPDQYMVAFLLGDGFDAIYCLRKKTIGYLRKNDGDRPAFFLSQPAGIWIG